ncbi:asparagine synthase (glutamine-hydrolysing) [Nostoc carneum NIES-2107]|nr:asparagine synthase (glutamine-hydrolysing) [Nostoc carneum NIES-2107]
MPGLYVTIGHSDIDRITAAAKRLTFFPDEHGEIIVEPDLAIAWVSQDDPTLFAPAFHSATGVRVITSGRVAWDESAWQTAEKLDQYQGGLSNRLLLNQYLSGGVSAVERHNGSAALVIYDPREQQIHLFSDHFGFYPLFAYQPQSIPGCVISSFPDAIADDPVVTVNVDPVSMAEFLWQWKATPPHTYYQEIKYVGAATHSSWNLAQKTYHHRQYWQPFQEKFYSHLSQAVIDLEQAVRHSIHIRTLPRLSPVVSYTSGGLDSRVVLFTAADPNSVIGFNLYDIFNQEAIIAKQLCQEAGIKYVGFARDDDYYPRWMHPGVKISGGMWSLEDNHFLGTREEIRQLGTRTVLSACLIDDFFKGENLDSSDIGIWGRKLPLSRFKSQREPGFRTYLNSRPSLFAKSMEQRQDEWFAGVPMSLHTDIERLQAEDKRVRPVCYAEAVSGPLMFRILPYDAFLADRAIADCYSRIPPKWKLNATVWGKVVANICGNAIIDANYGWKPGASSVEKLLIFTRDWFRRRLGLIPKFPDKGPATNGSWPELGWYIRHSATLRQLWESTPKSDRQLMTDLWGSNPWQISLDQWAQNPYDFFRIATMLNYWAVRREGK